MKILVVDDEPINREVLGAPLKAAGHAVLTAGDGIEALAVLERKPVDVIISDILMPNMDGYRLCYEVRIRERLRHLPFVFYSGTFTSPGDEKLCYDLGGDRLLPKPASPESILKTLAEVTRRDRAPRAPAEAEAALKEYSARLVSKLLERNAELVAAMQQLEASETRLQSIIRTSPECIKTISASGRLLEMNPAGLAILEADAFDEVSDRLTTDWVAPEHYAAFDQLHQQVMRGESGSLAFEVMGLKGRRRWLETQAVPLRDPQGAVTALLGISRDITERRQADAARRRSDEHLAALINSVDGIVWESDVETFRFTFVSPRAERLLGYPSARWINEPAFWVDHIHPDDRKYASEYCLQCAREKRDHEFEYRMLAADGRAVWLRDIVTVVVEHGRPVKLRGIMVDITRSKQADEVRTKREAELERFHRLSVGRELRMIELKQEVNMLAVLAGQSPPYKVPLPATAAVGVGTDHD